MSSIGKLSGKVLLAEHLVFVLMLFWWFTVWLLGVARRLAAQKPKQPLEALKQIQRLGDEIRALEGPVAALSWPDVREAPAPSMDMSKLEDGQVAAHVDARGAIYRFKLHGDVHVNMYYTKAGHMRSGDLHDSNQYDVSRYQ
ncbi:hypothetical protein MNEG_11876 [Monoraphidium neglectum]|uniref:Uncharacterized protein n=1 Tax=Monoraphidium neglectum TaxID=145388 RepID=A0A0D2J8K0_9CHLO|nr:hypothetical protein MNEG_11876 [Monoraphidium neglectum]KIY96087.1 hypothetical protein MNEG_11876 [Monoraphidium neglectum]|eukprot:XP_013895107.1 hypothetical protein MNEG_11876 [Monoraphidium neglectum]